MGRGIENVMASSFERTDERSRSRPSLIASSSDSLFTMCWVEEGQSYCPENLGWLDELKGCRKAGLIIC